MVENNKSYKGLFISDIDWTNNARINCFQGFDVLAEGYQNGADILVNHVIENGTGQDTLVYPIVFLYRQHLELRFKEIIREGWLLLNEGQDFPTTHDLQILWGQVKKVIEKLLPDDEETQEEGLIEHIVNEFSTLDRQSMSFRYPEDKKGNNPLAGLQYINIRHLSEMLQEAYNFLYGVSAFIAHYRSLASEYSSDCCYE
ncbi:HEPN domain-containing protein [Phormidium sp. LEGE 05292]|uniref:HEPN domain-containing protein n=1 Tax=[Phormidium] sp. LEGE 05292 TaxID=767427 RepID=UPI00187E0463|nr:HEPN domain-containing protein [Phormidium sp. LEGE 05292]MBE9228291.1 HEPN domain-containing protein [Phormidium sp. LEGE 05292]